jgi:hypothetical protein
MKAWWILVLVGGRAPPPVLRALFFVFRVKVCRSGAPASCNKVSPASTLSRRQHREACGSGVLFEVFVWLWDLQIVKELHRQFFLLLRLRGGCGLLDPFGDFPSATNNVRPSQGGAAAAAHRRHGLEVEDEGLLKDLVVIFIFLGVICTVRCFF